MQLPSQVTCKQEGGRARERRAQGIAARAERDAAPGRDCPCKPQPSNTLGTDLPPSLHAEPAGPSSPPHSGSAPGASAQHCPGTQPRSGSRTKAVPTEEPSRDRSWGRTMENPETHGGEAQSLVRVMPLYLWGPRVPPKQGQHLRTAPGAARPGCRSRDPAGRELGAPQPNTSTLHRGSRAPEEEGSGTGTCRILLPTTERPKLCRGLPKTCGRLSSGHQLKHTAESLSEPAAGLCSALGLAAHTAVPRELGRESPALPAAAQTHGQIGHATASSELRQNRGLFSEFLWEMHAK